MRQFKVKVYIDISNPEHVSALNSFLGVIGDQEGVKKPTEVVEKKPRQTRNKPIEKVEKVEKVEKIEKIEETTDDSSEIKIEDVRSKLSRKVGTNREEIKAKLKEYDAANVTSLDEKHYVDFIEFLDGLK